MPRPVIASDHLNPLVIQTALATAPAAAAAPDAAVVTAVAVAPAVAVAAAPAADAVVFGLVGWMLLVTERKTKRLL